MVRCALAHLRAAALLAVETVALSWTPLAMAADPPAGCSTSAGQTTCVFAYTGGPQVWNVPAGATSATFFVYGAQGGAGGVRGGFGGTYFGTAAVTPGAVMQVNVGGQGASASSGGAGGWNGGGAGFNPAGGGGGGSDVRQGACAASGSCALSDRVIVGGGGGGGAGTDIVGALYYGGDGGGRFPSNGYPLSSIGSGKAGLDIIAGAGGQNLCGSTNGADGGPGFGGAGGQNCAANGGGGGGGYLGGGGGGAVTSPAVPGGFSGGGGSGFVDLGMSKADGENISSRSGNGLVIIVTPLRAPTVTKSFGATTVALGVPVSLTFTITNPNPLVPLTGVQLLDDFPAGLVGASTSPPEGCNGGVIVSDENVGFLTMGGGTLPPGGSCTFSVMVKGTIAGNYTNTTDPVTTLQSPPGNAASANLTVLGTAPPSITKVFGAASVLLNGSTSLSFTLNNPNVTDALASVSFVDSLPSGLIVATPNGLIGSCGGGTITATAGSSFVQLAGASLAAGTSCNFSVNVTGVTVGVKNNSVTVNSLNGGTGNTSNASLTVVGISPPGITTVFGAASVLLNGTTSLSFTLNNPNAGVALSNVGFFDGLPSGLVVATPNGLTGSCGGGTITATAGSSFVQLAGASLAAGTSCNFSVNVTGLTAGVKNNSVTVNSLNGGTGNTSNASLTVVGTAPPGITTVFGAASVPLNGSTSLSFTLNNPNAGVTLSNVGFFDSLPSGLGVATPNGLIGSCGGGTVTATVGSTFVQLAGASLAAGASCNLSVNVTGFTAGVKNNSVTVNSLNGGTGNTSNASLTVLAIPAPSLDIDGSNTSSKYSALTDGLLIVRYLYGLTGASLTNGAMGATASRGPAEIRTYLDSIRSALDVDDNGSSDAHTDGLLLIRYLFGLRGNSLIAGAVDPLGNRKTAPEIESYIQSLMP